MARFWTSWPLFDSRSSPCPADLDHDKLQPRSRRISSFPCPHARRKHPLPSTFQTCRSRYLRMRRTWRGMDHTTHPILPTCNIYWPNTDIPNSTLDGAPLCWDQAINPRMAPLDAVKAFCPGRRNSMKIPRIAFAGTARCYAHFTSPRLLGGGGFGCNMRVRFLAALCIGLACAR